MGKKGNLAGVRGAACHRDDWIASGADWIARRLWGNAFLIGWPWTRARNDEPLFRLLHPWGNFAGFNPLGCKITYVFRIFLTDLADLTITAVVVTHSYGSGWDFPIHLNIFFNIFLANGVETMSWTLQLPEDTYKKWILFQINSTKWQTKKST